jgi:hypothetical protein
VGEEDRERERARDAYGEVHTWSTTLSSKVDSRSAIHVGVVLDAKIAPILMRTGRTWMLSRPSGWERKIEMSYHTVDHDHFIKSQLASRN